MRGTEAGMRKAFPAKVLADLGLNASSPRAVAAPREVPQATRGRRKRAVKAQKKVDPTTAHAVELLTRVSALLQPDLDDLDAAWD